MTSYEGVPYLGVPLSIYDASGGLDWFYGGIDFRQSLLDGNTFNDDYYQNSPYKLKP